MTQRVPSTLAIVVSGLYGLGIPVSFFMAAMSAMVFDAPGSENNPYLWGLVISLLTLPFLMGASIVASWVAWKITRDWPEERQGRGRTIRVAMALLPLLSVAALIISGVLLGVMCGGEFRCGAS